MSLPLELSMKEIRRRKKRITAFPNGNAIIAFLPLTDSPAHQQLTKRCTWTTQYASYRTVAYTTPFLYHALFGLLGLNKFIVSFSSFRIKRLNLMEKLKILPLNICRIFHLPLLD